MTERDAKETLEIFEMERNKHMANMPPSPYFDMVKSDNFTCSLRMAINALEEIQKYREIGTVEECRFYKGISEKDFSTSCFDLKIINELREYKEIGTVEECREARNRQIHKNPIETKKRTNGMVGKCPICNCSIVKMNYCPRCGQSILWE